MSDRTFGEYIELTVQAIRAVAGAELLIVEGTGFTANSSVELSREVDGKPQTAKFKMDANGRIEIPAILVSKDHPQGSVTVTMKSDVCAPAVKVNWEQNTYKVE